MPLPPPAQPLPSLEQPAHGPETQRREGAGCSAPLALNYGLKGRLLSSFPLEADVVHCVSFFFLFLFFSC